jgi:hypothetical protein
VVSACTCTCTTFCRMPSSQWGVSVLKTNAVSPHLCLCVHACAGLLDGPTLCCPTTTSCRTLCLQESTTWWPLGTNMRLDMPKALIVSQLPQLHQDPDAFPLPIRLDVFESSQVGELNRHLLPTQPDEHCTAQHGFCQLQAVSALSYCGHLFCTRLPGPWTLHFLVSAAR